MPKLLIIALDGATFQAIDPWIDAGQLPNLARFKADSAYGSLESTLPPITGAAWTTFQTGVNPGKHGFFDWLRRDPKGYNLVPISANQLPVPTIWDILSNVGVQVGVLGVPVTYPPRPVNGFLVSGILSPPGAAYTYPKALQAELESAVPGYTTMPAHWPGRYRAREWFEDLSASLERKLAATRFLLKKPWDVFMVHLMETDSVQHQMWHVLDGVKRPKYHAEAATDNPILDIFKQFDARFPDLLAAAGEATTVVVLSDHGFGPLHWNIFLNNWLLQHGYLKLKRTVPTLLKRGAFFGLGFTPENMTPIGEKIGYQGRNASLRHDQIYKRMGRYFISHQNIDWRRSVAYSYGNVGQIYLNRMGREPQGKLQGSEVADVASEIRAGLLELTNPVNGERVMEQVHFKEDIYHGPATPEAPELMLVPQRGYMAVGTSEFVSRRTITPARWGSGWHQMDGIFMAKGGAIRTGKIEGARLLDVTPTLLYHLGLPVPSSMDGRVLESLYPQTHLEGHPVQQGPPLPDRQQLGDLPENFEEDIRKRLQSLGYI